MASETINIRVNQLITSLGLTQKKFADAIEVSPSTISTILGPRQSDPSASLLVKISKAFPNVDMNWLTSGQGTMFKEQKLESNAKFIDIPLKIIDIPFIEDAYASLGPTGVLSSIDLSKLPTISIISFPHWRYSDENPIYAIKARGDSMYPNIQDQDLLVIQAISPADWKYISKGVYLIITDEIQTVKRIQIPPNGHPTWTLYSDNPEYPNIEIESPQLKAIYKIINLQRDIK